MDLRAGLSTVVGGGTLSRAQAAALFGGLLDAEFEAAPLGALLGAMALRGETAEEIAGAADALRARMRTFEHGHRDAIDTCGTGGDGLGSFNVSTAAAIVAAAAGARVVKHGNRSQSSRCGSADLLEAAGIPLDPGPDAARAALDEAGITFLFAPAWHPLVARVGPVRKALGVRTLFNFLGPLCNPGRVRRQLLGVPELRRVEPMARALEELGHERAYVVHGPAGADELIPGAGNTLRPIGPLPHPAIPNAAGNAREALRGGDARDNLAILERVLAGERGFVRDTVLLNAGAALIVAGLADDLRAGQQRAAEAIDTGAARTTLSKWRAVARRAEART